VDDVPLLVTVMSVSVVPPVNDDCSRRWFLHAVKAQQQHGQIIAIYSTIDSTVDRTLGIREVAAAAGGPWPFHLLSRCCRWFSRSCRFSRCAVVTTIFLLLAFV
jgi:hypothetical protein